MKFQVGDRVKIVKDEWVNNHSGQGLGYKFTIGQIVDAYGGGFWCREIEGESNGVHDSLLQLVGGSMDDLKVGQVLVNNRGREVKILVSLPNAIALSGDKDFDFLEGWYTPKEIQDNEWKIKDESEVTELTMDEVADKFGISVDKLKIKKN